MKAPYDLEPDEWVADRTTAFNLDALYNKFLVFLEKLTRKFKRSEVLDEVVPEIRDDCKPGDEMTQELTDAWNLFTRVRDFLIKTPFMIRIYSSLSITTATN